MRRQPDVAAVLLEARGALSEDGAGAGPPPQRSAGGGTGEKWRSASCTFRHGARSLLHTVLVEPRRPQERILQRTEEQFGDFALMVQILGALVPQPVEQLADVLVRNDELVRKQSEEPDAHESAHSPPGEEGVGCGVEEEEEEEEEASS